ncbi:hypothetical protein DT065_14805 [Salicibibacter kimchii]|uniref:Uncharacterized protein n=1 Tax=Salicibibacter kimchii TaxID=2099786 RepID=A0A345C1Q9_9BACI|nr:hypothetical protein DT065_14805 [Salicibibacter kimchii]
MIDILKSAMFIIASLIPFAFLGMYLDYNYQSLIMYIIWLIFYPMLGYFIASNWRTEYIYITLGSSFFISLILFILYDQEWSHFFKPFGTYGLFILLTGLSLLLLRIGVWIYDKRSKHL